MCSPSSVSASPRLRSRFTTSPSTFGSTTSTTGTRGVLFTVLAVNLWRRIKTGWGMTGLLAVHPVTMYAANFGLGAPLIIALHLNEPDFSSGLVWATTFLVYGLCALAVFGASKF